MYAIDVFRPVATTAEIAKHGKRNLAVLVAYKRAAKTKVTINGGGHQAKKFTNHEINTAIRHVFLIFYLYFCTHMPDIRSLLFFALTKVSENSDIRKCLL
jgi:hypothetical protein